ncbi:SH2 domain containing 3Cb [Aplochiton taeniatus]
MDSSGEYVKFSKEGFWLEAPSEKLRKELEEELKLSSSNLNSHAWYHGRIPWEVSETLMVQHGDFLIRDSLSNPGGYVLTSHWNDITLHFPISKVLVQSSEAYSRMQYTLEEEAFNSVPSLVHFYIGNRTALTQQSGAQIHSPVNRTLPLRYLEENFSLAGSNGCVASSPSCQRGKSTQTVDPECCSYTELQPGPPAQSYVERLCAGKGSMIDQGKEKHGEMYCAPVVEKVSVFRPTRYQSPLMPMENKPLEVGILRRVKKLLAEVDARTAAEHITKADCMVARILEVSPDMQKRMGVRSGMELLTLPHGSQLRLDLLERFQTMAIMLAVDILGCTGTTEERAALLNKTIQIAAELRINLGNMFGFAAIMRTLELPQISRLEQTWMMLRRRHTASAILYEKTLKPFMKCLNDGKESYPLSNTSFPHVVPLLSLLEKNVAISEGVEPWETVETGVDVVMRHLGAARSIAQLGDTYCSNAETKLQGFQEQPEVLEIFLTDFQMRLLWGSRGAAQIQAQRYVKFEQVLTVLSNKLEPSNQPQ